MSSSNIPLARGRLQQLLHDLKQGVVTSKDTYIRIRDTMPLLVRSKAVRRAPGKRHRFTPAEKAAIRIYARANPKKTLHDIATHFGVRNTGRISEIIRNKR